MPRNSGGGSGDDVDGTGGNNWYFNQFSFFFNFPRKILSLLIFFWSLFLFFLYFLSFFLRYVTRYVIGSFDIKNDKNRNNVTQDLLKYFDSKNKRNEINKKKRKNKIEIETVFLFETITTTERKDWTWIRK